MKVKSSKSILMKLICWAALVLLTSMTAFSQATNVSITAASNSGGSNTTYTYTLNSGPALEVGRTILISGMADAVNNGSFAITALGSGNFTVVNASGVTRTGQTGTGIEFRITSGALLTIDGTAGNAVNIKLYDSQIHSTNVQVVPTDNGSNCLAGDQIPTDAYILQGGAPTGCDPNDPYEVTDDNSISNTHQDSGQADRSGFHIETHYRMQTIVNITGASAASAGNTTYDYSLTSGPDLQANENIVITGMVPDANNGTFTISSVVSGTSFTANNGSGVADGEQHGTGTAPCNKSGSVCANPDTGFLTVTNSTSSPFTGTISLTGVSPIAGGYCPAGGMASDSSSAGLAIGASVTLALSTDSSNCGGFNQAQHLTLSNTTPSTAAFGKDDYVIAPLNSNGDTLDILPIPVPAGPLGSDTFGPFPPSCVPSCTFQSGAFGSESPIDASPLRFGAGSNFAPTKYACVPYADFSADKNPVCVELQVTPGGTLTPYLYNVTNDFSIDANSLPGGIGGPAFLGHHVVPCPDSGFDQNLFLQYIAAPIGDPLKGGGSGGGSCWVVAFDPSATAVTTGTVNSFTGFSGLLAPPSFNRVNIGSAFPLNFTFPTAGLHLCSTVNNSGSSCTGGASRPWVAFGTLSINCTTKVVSPTQTEQTAAAGGSNLQTISTTPSLTSYRFNWKTSKTSTTPPPPIPGSCVVMVAQFSSGLTVFPDYFQFK